MKAIWASTAVMAMTIGALGATVPPALADKPALDGEPHVIVACGGVEIIEQVVMLGSKAHARDDGSLLFTGAYKLQYTNAATGQSVLINASGPAVVVFNDDGSMRIDGRGLGGGLDPDGGISRLAGPMTVLVHADGSNEFLTDPVHQWDYCPLLT